MENIKEWENRCNEMLFDSIVSLAEGVNALNDSQAWKTKTIKEFDNLDLDEALATISDAFNQLNVVLGQKGIILAMKEGVENEQ